MKGMRKRDLLIALALAASFGLAVVLFGAIGLASTGGAGHERYVSARYGFSVPVPAGWHRARARLVPNLLDPREILSLGNFGMRVGGGGNCGREPAAAIDAMKPGDALVTVQEVGVFAGLRSHLRHDFPPRADRSVLAGKLRTGAFLGDSRTAGAMRYEKLAFSESGRAFEALVYVDGPPTPALRRGLGAILAGLRFRPGSWGRFHGDEIGPGPGRQ
jgi:hypothetical protein